MTLIEYDLNFKNEFGYKLILFFRDDVTEGVCACAAVYATETWCSTRLRC